MNQISDEKTGPLSDKHRLAAIVFINIVGSTAIMERDEKLALENLTRMREAAYPLVESHNGTIIKELGNGFLALFNSVIKATTCSLGIQKELQDEEDPKLRISIHIGDVVVEKGDVFGSGVNIASRMNSHASPGGITVSGDVWRQLQNKTNYSVRSLGFKKLKGVGEPFEVFELLESAQAAGKRAPFVQGLKRSRIPHFLVSYLIGSWSFVYFSTWFVNRYLLSPHIIDFIFTALATLAPTAVLVGYSRTQPGAKTRRFKKLGIPLNLALSGFLLFGLFRDKDLGSMMANVSVINEAGESVQRTVPKGEFRKRVFFHFFENQTGDTTLNWMQQGLTDLVTLDLSQDPFLTTYLDAWEIWVMNLNNWGPYPVEGTGLLLTQKQELAIFWHAPLFFSGSFSKKDSLFELKTTLYETRNCKPIAERTFEGRDVFKLVDELTVQLKHDLKIPSHHIETVKDLPVSELATNSIPALQNQVCGKRADIFYRDYENALRYSQKSLEADSTNATAYYDQYGIYNSLLQDEKGKDALQKGMRYLYKLPEGVQYSIKWEYYVINQETEKAKQTVKIWAELFPSEEALHYLIDTYRDEGKIDEAISESKHLLEESSDRWVILLRLANLYGGKGNQKEAMKYYQKMEELYPDDPRTCGIAGNYYLEIGDYKRAKSSYQKAVILKPDYVPFQLGLMIIEVRNGNFKTALEHYQEYLKNGNSAHDSSGVYFALKNYYEQRGQMGKMYENLQARVAIRRKMLPPAFTQLDQLKQLPEYIKAGRKEEALKLLPTFEKQYSRIEGETVFSTKFYIYINLDAADSAQKALEDYEQCRQGQPQNAFGFYARGRIDQARGNFKDAIQNYERASKMEPNNTDHHLLMGECYRGLKNYRKAEEHLQKTLRVLPYQPNANYDLALVYAESGKEKKALDYLNKALYVWAEADTDYEPAKRAREKLAEMEGKR